MKRIYVSCGPMLLMWIALSACGSPISSIRPNSEAVAPPPVAKAQTSVPQPTGVASPPQNAAIDAGATMMARLRPAAIATLTPALAPIPSTSTPSTGTAPLTITLATAPASMVAATRSPSPRPTLTPVPKATDTSPVNAQEVEAQPTIKIAPTRNMLLKLPTAPVPTKAAPSATPQRTKTPPAKPTSTALRRFAEIQIKAPSPGQRFTGKAAPLISWQSSDKPFEPLEYYAVTVMHKSGSDVRCYKGNIAQAPAYLPILMPGNGFNVYVEVVYLDKSVDSGSACAGTSLSPPSAKVQFFWQDSSN